MPLSSDMPVLTRKTENDDFDKTFLANYASLGRLLYRVVGDVGSAEELAAEAFWKLHRQPPATDHNLVGWLYRTGLNLALDHLRRQKRRVHYEALAGTPPSTQSPEETVCQIQKQNQVRKILAAIKREQASLLVLRSEGYSLAEIASFLSISPGSVGTFLARADKAFRREYINRYGER